MVAGFFPRIGSSRDGAGPRLSPVLVPQPSQLTKLAHIESGVLVLPPVERPLRDPQLLADLRHHRPRFGLPQRQQNLLGGELTFRISASSRTRVWPRFSILSKREHRWTQILGPRPINGAILPANPDSAELDYQIQAALRRMKAR